VRKKWPVYHYYLNLPLTLLYISCKQNNTYFFIGKDCPVDYERVYDHVKAKMPYKTEEPLDAASVINAAKEMLSSEEYDCLSDEFKKELM